MSIGVLAFRGEQDALERWTPTADYLTETIHGYSFKIVPLSLEGMFEQVADDRLDFVLTNTGNYVVLEYDHGISRLATIKSRHLGKVITQFGAVIFTRQNHPAIHRIENVTGHSMSAVSENAFGGFQMAWRELIDVGIDPFDDMSELRFTGFPQDDIVHAVIAGDIDFGTVRSGTLERMAAENLIDLGDIKILGARSSRQFPFLHSTRLYPEWPFAKARRTQEDLAQRVAVALLELQPENPAVASAYAVGWTIPLDYGPVHELFRELEIGPYAYLGRPSLESVWREYKGWILFSMAMIMLLIILLVTIVRANRRISLSESKFRAESEQHRQARESLAHHKQELERHVEERTTELARANDSLRRSEAMLRAIHDITSDAELGLNTKIETLLREGCRFFNMEVAIVSTTEQSANNCVCRVQTTTMDEHHLDLLANYLRSEISSHGAPAAIPDLSGFQHSTVERLGLYGSALATSYLIDDQIAGYLLFTGNTPRQRAFTDVDIDILQLMAQWLGGESERREINQRVQQHQAHLAHIARLNTMGEMATGIAHELNQPLTAILNYSNGSLRMLEKDSDVSGELSEAIGKISNDARRAADIIKRLRDFIKRGKHRYEHFAIGDCIQSAVELLGSRLKQHAIEVDVSDQDQSLEVIADRIQIEQVVVNLLLNAVEALQASDQSDRNIYIEIASGNAGETTVAVSDSGRGLSDEVIENLFEPFFSTKGEGMGMGLSISRSIIEAHGGNIEYLLNEMHNPTFRFKLPQL